MYVVPVWIAFGSVGLPVLLLVILAAVSCEMALSAPLVGRTATHGTRAHYHGVLLEPSSSCNSLECVPKSQGTPSRDQGKNNSPRAAQLAYLIL